MIICARTSSDIGNRFNKSIYKITKLMKAKVCSHAISFFRGIRAAVEAMNRDGDGFPR